MKKRIRVLKGHYDKIRIMECTFPLLKPVDTSYGRTTATVDGSELFGQAFKSVIINVEDYRILD